MLITIDGLAATGKGAVARSIAKRLGYYYVDLGLILRSYAYLLKHNIVQAEEGSLADAPKYFKYIWDGDSCAIYIKGQNITEDLYSIKIGEKASQLAALPGTMDQFRELCSMIVAHLPKAICDGRAAGSFIFPQADYKFYLSAEHNIRAERRLKQLQQKGLAGNIREVQDDLRRRDTLDMTRPCAPDLITPDMKVIDTTDLSLEMTVEQLLDSLQ